MPRPTGTDGDLDNLGALITAAFGLDTAWMDTGKCRDYREVHQVPFDWPTPWQVEDAQKVDGVRGRELINAALMVCHSCPAQYDCASFGVDGRMKAGTWGMRIGELHWLQHQADSEQIILNAKRRGVPIQIHVDVTRRRRNAA